MISTERKDIESKRISDLKVVTPKKRPGNFTKQFVLGKNVKCQGKIYTKDTEILKEEVGEEIFNILLPHRL